MSEDTSDLTVTLKAGTRYDAPWIVVRGDNPEDVTFKLNNLDSVIEATLEAAGKFAASSTLGAKTVAQEPAQQAAPPTKQQGWGGQSRAQGGQATSKFGAPLHPEGKTCEICPNVLEKTKTSSGKPVWRCSEWRWANGNPNGHTNEFID